MSELIQGFGLIIGILFFVSAVSYTWTAVGLLTENSMSKHKVVCDLCFRNIKEWNKRYHATDLDSEEKSRANSGPVGRKHRENELPISATKNQVHKRRSES